VDAEGHERTLASGFTDMAGLSWSPTGDEIWFGGSREGSGAIKEVHAVSISGHERLVAGLLGNFEVFDVSRGAQVVGGLISGGADVHARARGAAEEAEMPATDYAFLSDLSDDGTLVLGTDVGEGGGQNFRFYVQKTDGSPAVWLGEGDGQALSPDGRFALAVLTHAQPQQLIVVPVGAGETRVLEHGDVVRYQRAVWDRTGQRVVFAGVDKQESLRVYVQPVAGGPPKPVTPDGVALNKIGRPVSPDGQRVVAIGPDDVPALYPLTGGEPVAIPGLGEGDVALCWTPDGRALIVAHYEANQTQPRVELVDVASGHTRPWDRRTAPSGATGQSRILVTPDGESYAYSYDRQQTDLWVASNFR
jgi:Tol biopolymer transport system component